LPERLRALNARALDVARQQASARRNWKQSFPEAWERGCDLLLAIYLLSADGGEVATTHAAQQALLPLTSGLRWIEKLERAGLITRGDAADDPRKSMLRLTQSAAERVEAALLRSDPHLR
jgi:hypothetical protein